MQSFLPYDTNDTYSNEDVMKLVAKVGEDYMTRGAAGSALSHEALVKTFWNSVREAFRMQYLDSSTARIGTSGGAEFLQIKVAAWNRLSPAWVKLCPALGIENRKAHTAVQVSFTVKNRGRCNMIPISLVPADLKDIILPKPKEVSDGSDDDNVEDADHAPLSDEELGRVPSNNSFVCLWGCMMIV
jgi:hypothetical protein